MWDRASGQAVKRLQGHTYGIRGIAVNPSNPLEVVSHARDDGALVQVLDYSE